MWACPTCLLEEFVVPEFLQEDATVENLTQAAVNLYDDTETRRRTETLFAGFASVLDVDTAELAAAAIIGELAATRAR